MRQRAFCCRRKGSPDSLGSVFWLSRCSRWRGGRRGRKLFLSGWRSSWVIIQGFLEMTNKLRFYPRPSPPPLIPHQFR